MSNKTELRQLVDLIKHRARLTQTEIAELSGYKRTYLSEALSMDKPPDKLITKLKLTFKDVLENEQIQTPFKKDAQESPKNDYTDEYIRLLKEKALGFNSNDLKEKVELILAHQRVFYTFFERLLAKIEKLPAGTVRSEMDKELAESLRRIQRKGSLNNFFDGT